MAGILVLGAGGHGKVVADILRCAGQPVRGFLDDTAERWGTRCLGLPVLGAMDGWAQWEPDGLVMGVGANRARWTIVARLGEAARPLWLCAVHPSAILADTVPLGAGVVVAAGAIVNPDTRLGDHAILNTGASVDHDCDIGAFAHIAPGARLAGGVRVGEGALLGLASAVIPGRAIGAWATIGAGAAVVRDVPDGVTAVGVPARW